MALPWKTIAYADTEEGTLTLVRRGDDFLIKLEHDILMTSIFHRSEAALGSQACETLAAHRCPRVLIAGLGMGFTLRAALDVLPGSAKVIVAELNPAVVGWCRGPLAALTSSAVDDPRVEVHVGDVADLIASAAISQTDHGEAKRMPQAPARPQRSSVQRLPVRLESSYDAIILDLYQGTHGANKDPGHPFFGRAALERTRNALAKAGLFAIWTEDPDPRFERRLRQVGFDVQYHRPKGGPRHVVYIATKG